MKQLIISMMTLMLTSLFSPPVFAASDYFSLHQKYSVLNCPAASTANQNANARRDAIGRCLDNELSAIDQSINQRYEQLLAKINAKTTDKKPTSKAIPAEKQNKKSIDPLVLPAPNVSSPAAPFNLSQETLEKSQQAWLKYRAATCGFETSPSAKSPTFENHIKLCLLSYTRERSEYLQWFLEHQD